MEENQETRIAYKRTFTDFLDRDNGKGEYISKITQMKELGRHRLEVDLSDLRSFDNDLARRLIHRPGDFLPSFEDALDEVLRNIDGKYLKEGDEVHIGLKGQFGYNKVTPRELLSDYLGSLVCVEGIVTKCSLVRPKVVKSVHYCPKTGEFRSKVYKDITSFSGAPTGSTYPTKDDNGNVLVTEFGLCKYRDHQTLSIQEMPENSPAGQLPRSIDVIVEDDLVDSCKPGDRVSISGVYKAVASRAAGGASGTFRSVLVANNAWHLNKDIEAPKYRTEDLKNIKKIANRADAWELLGESIAPSIYGHKWIKKAVLLLLLGGTEKNLKNGAHIRGDINMMMVGDPSVAKSQILRAIMSIAPLAISTTGRGSTGVGLTAAVTQDQETGEKRLEAGAMVLGDRGVVCIDEFDKMSDLDRVAIHEVMEQQTVTIAKAGIHASLNARCTVVAAANPIYGNYDHSLTPTRNIGLPDSLLSRFDLLFIVLDHMDVEIDREISEHVLRMHRYRNPGDDDGVLGPDVPQKKYEEDEENELEPSLFMKYDRLLHGEKKGRKKLGDVLTRSFLKKFIHYAKSRTPKLTEEASDKIAEAYATMRVNGMAPERKESGSTLPITARTLETMIRLSTAHAKLKLRKEVIVADVEAALQLVEFAIHHRELQDMDDREERRREEGGGEGEGGNESGVRLEEGRDSGGNGNTPQEDIRGPKRQKQKKSSSQPSEGKGATETTEGKPESAEEIPRDEAQETITEVQNKASASLAEIMAAEEPHVEVTAERMEAFRTAFSAHVMATRAETLRVEEVSQVVNNGNLHPFGRPEIDAILLQMEADNQVMYADGVIHMI